MFYISTQISSSRYIEIVIFSTLDTYILFSVVLDTLATPVHETQIGLISVVGSGFLCSLVPQHQREIVDDEKAKHVNIRKHKHTRLDIRYNQFTYKYTDTKTHTYEIHEMCLCPPNPLRYKEVPCPTIPLHYPEYMYKVRQRLF